MDCPDLGMCNPSVIQPNVRRQATFLNRDTESVVALTPNIKLGIRRSSFVVASNERQGSRKGDNRSVEEWSGQQSRGQNRKSPCAPSATVMLLLANDERPRTNDGFSGGADRDRTGGLLVANQALSQLSYRPGWFSNRNLALSTWQLAFSHDG